MRLILLGAILFTFCVSAAENNAPPSNEYKTTTENDYIWVPEDTKTPVIPNGTNNTRICKFKSSRGLCYRLQLDDGTPGGIPIPYDTHANFQTLLDLLDREPDKSACEISPEIWSPYVPQSTIPTACGTHTYTEVSSCSQLPDTCPDACAVATRTRTATVTNPPCGPPPSVSISANRASVSQGDIVGVTWSSSNADRCDGNFAGANTTGGSGSFTMSYLGSHSFVYTCYNSSGPATDTATVAVSSAPAPTVSLTATPSSVNVGQNFTASWSATNASSCTSANVPGVGVVVGSTTMSFGSQGSRTLTIECSGPGGRATDSATVTVNQPAPAPSVSISAPATINEGVAFNTWWNSHHTTRCWSANVPSINSATSGHSRMSLSPGGRRYTLTVTCEGPGGRDSASTDVVVVAPSGGGSGSGNQPTWRISGPARCESTNFQIDWGGITSIAGQSCSPVGSTTGRSSAELCQWFPGQPEKRHTMRFVCR